MNGAVRHGLSVWSGVPRLSWSRIIPAEIRTWSAQAMPIIAAILFSAYLRQQAVNSPTWPSFALDVALVGTASLPFLFVHLIAHHVPPRVALPAWLIGFVLYPLAVVNVPGEGQTGIFTLTLWECGLAAAFSAAALLFGREARGRYDGGNMASILRHLPVTLDGVVIALLAAWTLASTSLFASTPDAVNNQPLGTWLDPSRIAANPGEFLGYLWQFSIVAMLLYGFYWGCRQFLIRRALHRHGWIFFALASLAYWIVIPPLVCSVILLLPVNPPDWSLLPSESHNPFDPANYGFFFVIMAVAIPILLASERLVTEQVAATGRTEQVRAELHALQQQINPHFLFNSLNTIYALCLQNRPDSAVAVVKLSDLLRYVVYDGQKEWVGLDAEIEYLRNYIDLQLLRLGERCRVSCHWPDDAAAFAIPPLLLIMLVENAFKHGVEPSDQPSETTIHLAIEGGRMRFTCVNTLAPVEAKSGVPGMGLGNLQRRLELLFGGEFRLTSTSHEGNWRAELEVDLRPC